MLNAIALFGVMLIGLLAMGVRYLLSLLKCFLYYYFGFIPVSGVGLDLFGVWFGLRLVLAYRVDFAELGFASG